METKAQIEKWPDLKKALWHVVMDEKVNDGHYIKAFPFVERLYEAALTALSEQEATSVFAEVQSIWAYMLAVAPASPPALHGPYGWLIMPEGLNEEYWHLADEPEPGTPSEPLFSRRGLLPASPRIASKAEEGSGTDEQ